MRKYLIHLYASLRVPNVELILNGICFFENCLTIVMLITYASWQYLMS